MMTGRPVIGLILALLVEASHWTRLRWDFDDESCSHAWQFTCIGIGLATVLIWLDGDRYTALPNLLTWLPPLLVPMQFIQTFGLRDAVPLNTFSFLAKQRRKRNLRLGLTEAEIYLNFGNVYFVTAMVAATLGSRSNANDWAFLTGIIILTGWMLLASSRSRPAALVLSLCVAGGIAVAGQRGLQRAEEWIGRGGGQWEPKFNPNSANTLIGKLGRVQQSPDIVWRLTPVQSPAPRLLRTASYNNYRASTWENQRQADDDFKDVDLAGTGADAYYRLKENADERATSSMLPSFTLRGAAAAESPLPLPGDASSLKDFALDGIERNTFGTIRIFPKESVIEGMVLWRSRTNPESPPLPLEDLKIPIPEHKVIQQIAREIGILRKSESLLQTWSQSPPALKGDLEFPTAARTINGPISRENTSASPPDLQGKLALLRTWFHRNFKYSKILTISSPSHVSTPPTAIAQFLTTNRTGHCEYFATATTLLLRAAGIPARYTTGYAVMEWDPKRGEFVVRGTHGHAWCRYWNQQTGTWLDFDTTPPDWLPGATPPNTSTQWFGDGLKRLREDFFLWRNRPRNRLGVTLVMSTIALGVMAFVVKRLWKSKRRLETRTAFNNHDGPVIRTPLHDLEPQARKLLGFRPLGQPFAEWLAQLAPSVSDSTILDEALALHQRLRFDPAPSHPEERERLAELVRQLNAILKRNVRRAS